MDVTFFGAAAKLLAAWSAWNLAFARSQRLEDRVEPLRRFLRTTDHHAVTAIDAPHATAGSNVDIVDTLPVQFFRAPNVVFEIGVAAINDRIARLHVLGELLYRGFRRTTRGNHDPDRTRRFKLRNQI